MNIEELKKLITEIVNQANSLKNKYLFNDTSLVNYACIFSQSHQEYDELISLSKQIGEVIKEMPTGFLFKISPLKTIAGNLQLLKIRIPDPTRLERGDADFTILNYSDFKNKYLSKTGFKLMDRSDFEMIELMDSEFNVRAYFSNPPLDKQLGIK